jgi:hypothetical protein
MRIARLARRLLLAAAVLAGPASAAVYTGVWDPKLDDAFDNLGWRGSADFFVPDACVPSGTVDLANNPGCGGLAAVTSATVIFYALDDVLMTPQRTLVIDASTLVVDTLRFVDGQLAQLSTSLSDALRVDMELASFGVPAQTQFALQFTLADGPRLAFTDPVCQRQTAKACETLFNDGTKYPPQFRIGDAVPVSAPATLPLVALAGLGLLAASRRRAVR